MSQFDETGAIGAAGIARRTVMKTAGPGSGSVSDSCRDWWEAGAKPSRAEPKSGAANTGPPKVT